MTFFKKFATSIGITCMAIAATTVMIASAASTSYELDYNEDKIAQTQNIKGRTATVHCNTRPISGTMGVRVTLYSSDGSGYLAAKTFPYYTSTTDLTHSFSKNKWAYIYGQAVDEDQTVTGTLSYFWS